jgi:hypothetical protein
MSVSNKIDTAIVTNFDKKFIKNFINKNKNKTLLFILLDHDLFDDIDDFFCTIWKYNPNVFVSYAKNEIELKIKGISKKIIYRDSI